jgi:hypothetical protein
MIRGGSVKTPVRLVLITLGFFGAASSLYATNPPQKKAGPTVQELQQQIIDLQGQLLACRGSVTAAMPDPMKEAIEAFQAFSSTIDTGINYQAYRDALIPLKVKVDKLPDTDSSYPMKKTVKMFVDAGQLWHKTITSDVYFRNSDVEEYLEKYNEEWQVARSRSRYGCERSPDMIAVLCVADLKSSLIQKGQERIKQFVAASATSK